MPYKELTTIEKIEINLFKWASERKVALTTKEDEILKRYQHTFAYWHEKPDLRDSQIVEYMMGKFGIEKSQAYRDLPHIKYLLGNVRNASKEWHRYVVVETCKEAIQKARADKNWIAMIMAADKIGKYTMLDKDDQERMPWDEIVPPEFEASPDINILNPKLYSPDIEERRKKLRAKYSGVEDAEFTEEQ